MDVFLTKVFFFVLKSPSGTIHTREKGVVGKRSVPSVRWYLKNNQVHVSSQEEEPPCQKSQTDRRIAITLFSSFLSFFVSFLPAWYTKINQVHIFYSPLTRSRRGRTSSPESTHDQQHTTPTRDQAEGMTRVAFIRWDRFPILSHDYLHPNDNSRRFI